MSITAFLLGGPKSRQWLHLESPTPELLVPIRLSTAEMMKLPEEERVVYKTGRYRREWNTPDSDGAWTYIWDSPELWPPKDES